MVCHALSSTGGGGTSLARSARDQNPRIAIRGLLARGSLSSRTCSKLERLLWWTGGLSLLLSSGCDMFAAGPTRVDPWQAIFTIVVFALLLVILRVAAWKPMLNALKNREDFIRNTIEQTKKDREEADAALKKYQEQIEGARRQATAIVEEGRRDAEVLRRKLQDEARQEADAILERAKREIGIARDTAVKDLYTLTGRLATDLAGRIIQKELDPAKHEMLIQESIESFAELENKDY